MAYETATKLNYKEFLLTMKDIVQNIMGDKYSVEINHVIKNNSVELDGLTILCDNVNVTPNIYLNTYYNRYIEGEEYQELATEIVGIYEDTMAEGEKEALCISYELEEMKPFIIYRLVNFKKNIKLLKEIPHILFLDLAITFHCVVKNNEEGIGTIRITNEHLAKWETDIEEIKSFAYKNTPKLFPSQLRNMNDVIKDILKRECTDMPWQKDTEDMENAMNQSADDTLSLFLDSTEQRKSEAMYVLTNSKGINGASCLLYPQMLQQLAATLNSDFYILPSSIHEVILVADHGAMDKKTLREMVRDVNSTQVAEDEILSDEVYYYSLEDNDITI